jgi:hypothetical protein
MQYLNIITIFLVAELSRLETDNFLKEFLIKMETFDVIFIDRNKNVQALLDLEITPIQRKNYLKKLQAENYLSGPNLDIIETKRQPYW